MTSHVEIAVHALARMQGMMSQVLLGFGQWLQVLSFALSQPKVISIIGDPEDTDTRTLLNVVRNGYRTFEMVVSGAPGSHR